MLNKSQSSKSPSRTQISSLRRAFRRGDGKAARELLKDSTADSIELLKDDYREQIGRDLEYDMRGFSPVPTVSFGPGFRVRFHDGLEGDQLQETLHQFRLPGARETASELERISTKTQYTEADFKRVFGDYWNLGGEERDLVANEFAENTGSSMHSKLKPFFEAAVSHNDSQPLPGKPEKRVAVVVSSGNWKECLEGSAEKAIGGYHWREIEAYVDEALKSGFTPVLFTPDGLPASPDSLSLLQGQIAPKLGFGMLPGTGPESEQGQAIVEGLTSPRSLNSLKAEDFAAIHVAGGHGSHHDLVGNENLEATAVSMNKAGKLVTAVCHATPSLGSLIEGEEATGFSPLYDSALLRGGYVLPEFDPPYNAHQGLRDLGAEVSGVQALNIHHTEKFEKNGTPIITGTGPEATDNVARQAFRYLSSK